jgi:hypothetical protein
MMLPSNRESELIHSLFFSVLQHEESIINAFLYSQQRYTTQLGEDVSHQGRFKVLSKIHS